MKATARDIVVLLALLGVGVVSASGGDNPPHTHEVSPGMLMCDDGYVQKAGPMGYYCDPEEDAPPGPQVITSEVPSAGDGRPQAGCPAGGCRNAIPEKCKADWPSDYAMQVSCIRRQTKALRELEGYPDHPRPAASPRRRRRP